MSNRKHKKSIADDTLKIMEQGYFMTPHGARIEIKNEQQYAEEQTITYSPEMSDDLIKNLVPVKEEEETTFEVNNHTTLDATRKIIEEGFTDVLCLNFASAKNPGGGFLGGSQAQEESIARATGLYNCLLKGEEYYQTNRNTKSCFYTDYMIYSPKVPIFKDENGVNHSALNTTSVITAPAVNTGIVKQREAGRIDEIEEVMKRRIEKVLAIAYKHKHSALVLGAWGCGVFQNNPEDIAPFFKWVIDTKFKNVFRKIVFAVYSRNERFIKPFIKEFA